MEDNNGINRHQSIPVEITEESFNKLKEDYDKLYETAHQLYARCKQLENTWMLQRADFLFKVLDSSTFSVETKQKAVGELTTFLFPRQEEDINEPKTE